MPTYEYACKDCGRHFDIFQGFHEDSLTVCPECQGHLRKKFNSVGVVFKGSGFYRNDSRASSVGADSAAPAAAGSATSAAASGSGGTGSGGTGSGNAGSGGGSSDAGSSAPTKNSAGSASATAPATAPAASS
ncbi:FmdB family zinc ribbon protein [Galactobacter caseinivorans]|uniref:FmdB family transcriptional regulator n=1 Tax=Galactobacter caseinivorans TaxID=2676123 RepID=A0A496PLV1_9MICC|nr:FmdB family zinc ribbon protein [Galactobacter caseinivorans]RKW71521.1 FmdB family transcriptional regulator [Galactobacter caseinivorans]